MTAIKLNGKPKHVESTPDTPLLWVLRAELQLTGTKYGCGTSLCGACTVHMDGQAVRSCVTPLASLTGKKILTIESLGTTDKPHALQAAWIAEQVPQCGYCQSGMLMAATALLARKPKPSDADIDEAMTNISGAGSDPPRCRHGHHGCHGAGSMKRRTWLLSGLGATGALVVGWGVLPARSRLGTPAMMLPTQGDVALNGWIKVRADGGVALAMHRSEMGQGIHTALAMLVAEDEQQSVLTATQNGYGKRTSITEYTRHGRGTKGMIAITQSERNGRVVAATLVHTDDEIMLITDKGVLVRTRVSEIRELGRATQGVTLIGLDEGSKLSGLQRIVENDANPVDDDAEPDAEAETGNDA
eukprot:gene14050-29909_t